MTAAWQVVSEIVARYPSVAEAARAIGVSRKTLWRIMEYRTERVRTHTQAALAAVSDAAADIPTCGTALPGPRDWRGYRKCKPSCADWQACKALVRARQAVRCEME